MNLKGKVGIVTGGGSGIGAAAIRRLLVEGAVAVAMDRDERSLRELSAAAASDRLQVIPGDVSSEKDAQTVVKECLRFGGHIDFLVNAAGVTHAAAPIQELSLDGFYKVISVNLLGTFLMMRYAAASMISGGSGGAIVNIASTGALRPVQHTSGYAASKFGVAGLTGAAALDLASHGIRVNAVCPGVTDTPLFRAIVGPADIKTSPARKLLEKIPLGRIGQADEIASAIAWLISDEASYVTGATLPVDGGLLLS